ncbi:MAG TPA: YebC/PmpR family DNA-binding transcriptional regulator, partial [Acidimicrobiales bacterium]|nr:YebC/PmpR family DNA-binding transcriptional regulator [Acidimicrobiales bacterium]
VALIVECLTDNRNRTSSDIRTIFSRNGGSMAEPGAVAWQFERKGVVAVAKKVSEDEIMTVALDAGGEDLRDEGDEWMLVCPPTDLPSLRTALEGAGIAMDSAELQMMPTTTVSVSDEAGARRVLKVIDLLEDLDDVQTVFSNFDIPDEVLEKIEL